MIRAPMQEAQMDHSLPPRTALAEASDDPAMYWLGALAEVLYQVGQGWRTADYATEVHDEYKAWAKRRAENGWCDVPGCRGTSPTPFGQPGTCGQHAEPVPDDDPFWQDAS